MAPEKIGALAEIVEKVVKKYPDQYFTFEAYLNTDWWSELQELVNNDRRLPDFGNIDRIVLDFLLNHYESEVHAEREKWDE